MNARCSMLASHHDLGVARCPSDGATAFHYHAKVFTGRRVMGQTFRICEHMHRTAHAASDCRDGGK